MKQNEIRTCEEYVLNELNKANEKVVALKNENEELQEQFDIVGEKFQNLWELVKELLTDSSVKEAQHNVSKASADERIAQGKVTAAENKAKMYNAQREERVDYVAGLAGSTVDNAEQNLNNNDNNSK